MPWKELARTLFAGMGYRVLRENTYQSTLAEEAKRLRYDAAQDGSLSAEEYGALRGMIERANSFAGPIIEIGTLLGRTTSKMALWTQPGKTIVTVDAYRWNPWGMTPEMHFQLTSLVLQYLVDAGQVIQVRCDKDEWFDQYRGEKPALVFCDADHSYAATSADIKFALAAGARIVSGHDYSSQHPGVIRAVDEHGGPAALTGSVWELRTGEAISAARSMS